MCVYSQSYFQISSDLKWRSSRQAHILAALWQSTRRQYATSNMCRRFQSCSWGTCSWASTHRVLDKFFISINEILFYKLSSYVNVCTRHYMDFYVIEILMGLCLGSRSCRLWANRGTTCDRVSADLPTSQITKVYFATPKSVFFTQKVYFTSKSQKDTHYTTFKHKNKLYNWFTR